MFNTVAQMTLTLFHFSNCLFVVEIPQHFCHVYSNFKSLEFIYVYRQSPNGLVNQGNCKHCFINWLWCAGAELSSDVVCIWNGWLINKKKSHATYTQIRAAGLLQCGLILTALMKGRLRIEPRTGILRMKPTTTGKKPLDVVRVGWG